MQETWLPTLKYSPGPGAAIFSARKREQSPHVNTRSRVSSTGVSASRRSAGMNEVTQKPPLRMKPRPLYYGVVDHEYLTTAPYTPSFIRFSLTHLPGVCTVLVESI
ncbi:hypothetical protein QQF64_024497 [Cirrhinus molitorella]|uniref:Uncharacterized protein n=1 Tax=Cirrhinus molitorella TaxID=172907 RepID=A0ABR3NLK5_9TELE